MATFSSCRTWKCQKCGAILVKGQFFDLLQAGMPMESVSGTNTCGNCGKQYSQAAVYAGDYDIEVTSEGAPKKRWPFRK